MKVVVFEPRGDGGLCHYSYNLAMALSQSGCEVTLLTDNRYELEAFPRSFEVVKFSLRSVAGIRGALSWLRKNRPAIIHHQGTNLHPLFEYAFMKLSRIVSGAAYVYTCHLVTPHEDPGAERVFIRPKLAQCDAMIVHSQVTKKEAHDLYNLKDEHISVIPHGNYKFFNQVKGLGKDIGWRKIEGTKDVLFFGAIRVYKGLSYLIDALALLRDKNVPVRLLIVGKPYEDWDSYVKQIEEKKLGDHVLMSLGYVDINDVPNYFAVADAVCLPYLDGSESGVLQLADAFDKPIIATETGGNLEAYEKGYVQALVPPKESVSLAAAIEKVLFEMTPEQIAEQKLTRNDGSREWGPIAATTIALYKKISR